MKVIAVPGVGFCGQSCTFCTLDLLSDVHTRGFCCLLRMPGKCTLSWRTPVMLTDCCCISFQGLKIADLNDEDNDMKIVISFDFGCQAHASVDLQKILT